MSTASTSKGVLSRTLWKDIEPFCGGKSTIPDYQTSFYYTRPARKETHISEHTPSINRVHDMTVTLSAAAASILRKRTQTT